MKSLHFAFLLLMVAGLSACDKTDEPVPTENFLMLDGYQHTYGTEAAEQLTQTTNDNGSITFQWSSDQSARPNKYAWQITLPAGASTTEDRVYQLGTRAVDVSEDGEQLATIQVLDIHTPEGCINPASLNGELSLRFIKSGGDDHIVLQFDDIQFVRLCDNEFQDWGSLSGTMIYKQ